ncbi:MAG: UDP-glucose 4-epimerase GalE [Acidimicrobiales bacterium]
MKVLVTGATGYLGSHTALELLHAGHRVIGVDDLSASDISVKKSVETLADRTMGFVRLDLRDRVAVDDLLAGHCFDAVIHFAGRKFVAESMIDPLRYFDRNVVASAVLFRAAQRYGVPRLVLSSSCTVYGQPGTVPVDENAPIEPVNPYGRTKAIVEEMLADLCRVAVGTSALALRYFNPIGAHPSGMLGETILGRPNNLLPYVMEVAAGGRPYLPVFGADYPTPDGTCVRDYIHVDDLAKAHVCALQALEEVDGFHALNIGTGTGSSVLEVLSACELAVGVEIPYRIVDRRPGDAAMVYAETSQAERVLNWRADRDIQTMCRDHWNFHRPKMGVIS